MLNSPSSYIHEITYEYKYLGFDFYSHGYVEPSSKRRCSTKYKHLGGHLKERGNSWSHVLGIQMIKSHLFKALVLPTFTHGTEIWGGDLKNSLGRILGKA